MSFAPPPERPSTRRIRPLRIRVADAVGAACFIFGSGAKNCRSLRAFSVCSSQKQRLSTAVAPNPRGEHQEEVPRENQCYRRPAWCNSAGPGMATPRRAAAAAAAALSRSSIGSGGSAAKGDEPQPGGRKVSRGTRDSRWGLGLSATCAILAPLCCWFGNCWRRID